MSRAGTEFVRQAIVQAVRDTTELPPLADTVASMSTGIAAQNRQYHPSTCACGAEYDLGKAFLAGVPDLCPLCAIKSELEVAAARDDGAGEPREKYMAKDPVVEQAKEDAQVGAETPERTPEKPGLHISGGEQNNGPARVTPYIERQ